MPIVITCRCDEHFDVSDEYAGKTTACPHCGHRTRVPSVATLKARDGGESPDADDPSLADVRWDRSPGAPALEIQMRQIVEGRRLRRAIRLGAMCMRVLGWLSGLPGAAAFTLAATAGCFDPALLPPLLILAACLGVHAWICFAANRATLDGYGWVPTAFGLLYLLSALQSSLLAILLFSQIDELTQAIAHQLPMDVATLLPFVAGTAIMNWLLVIVFLRAAVAIVRFHSLSYWCQNTVVDEEARLPVRKNADRRAPR
jgi:DNA-directed RNA polymerase subunit RPC12/RpoP